MSETTNGPELVDRARFELEFSDGFEGPTLAADRWVDHYLPQWTTQPRSAARYDFNYDGLRLRIDADQPAWRDDDGQLRVSNIQTGLFSGPVGSSIGTHRHVPDITVLTAVTTQRLWTPDGGLVEATLRAPQDSTCMLAIWLVGFEEGSPQDSGEITIAEIFGKDVSATRSQVRLGVKAINDPRLETNIIDVELPIDATQPHRYAAAWNANNVRIYIDDELVHSVDQGMDYPMQLMIDLFEFPEGTSREHGRYPKTASVRDVRGYRWK